jgi:hypothetical protein
MVLVQINPMTYIQAHFDGNATLYTDLDDGLMQLTRIIYTLKEGRRATYLTVSKEDARSEWRQNAANGWKRFH